MGKEAVKACSVLLGVEEDSPALTKLADRSQSNLISRPRIVHLAGQYSDLCLHVWWRGSRSQHHLCHQHEKAGGRTLSVFVVACFPEFPCHGQAGENVDGLQDVTIQSL